MDVNYEVVAAVMDSVCCDGDGGVVGADDGIMCGDESALAVHRRLEEDSAKEEIDQLLGFLYQTHPRA